MQHVLLDAEERTIRFARAGMRLDLGAVGKGYAIDCAVELLQELEIENALLHGGTSSVYALGNAPEGSPWRIAVQTPYGAAGHYLAEVALSGQSLSISAPHSKSFEQEGVRYGHVIDPRTGYPAQSSRLAALLMPSAAQGDALSTGLLALGPTGLATLSKYYPDLQGMVVLDTENHGQERTLLGSAWKVQTKT
jgi:thiamine biosynthesis lipoprotein